MERQCTVAEKKLKAEQERVEQENMESEITALQEKRLVPKKQHKLRVTKNVHTRIVKPSGGKELVIHAPGRFSRPLRDRVIFEHVNRDRCHDPLHRQRVGCFLLRGTEQ